MWPEQIVHKALEARTEHETPPYEDDVDKPGLSKYWPLSRKCCMIDEDMLLRVIHIHEPLRPSSLTLNR